MNTQNKLQAKLHEIIFEADTFAGKAFDVALLICILLSIGVVCLESMEPIRKEYGIWLKGAEWTFTLLFTLEYLLRIFTVKQPIRYILSFFGIIDLLSIIPTYLSLFLTGTHSLMVVRAIRLLRVFRVLKLSHFVGEADVLARALIASRNKIIVFTFAVSSMVLILGTLMYVIEGEEHGFTSIPKGVYWAIVTLTTVGYGDITPQTAQGQALSSIVMLIGYGIIAIPTGIVTSEMGNLKRNELSTRVNTRVCANCLCARHEDDACFCKHCGQALS